MAIFDLAKLDWSLVGWKPWIWHYGKKREIGKTSGSFGPVKGVVPGSVQQALLEAGLLEDWLIGLNSLKCEWVEHRHWDYSAEVPAGSVPTGERVFLDAQGLDYSGWICVDAKIVGEFRGALKPHWIELTEWLTDGAGHQLSIVFEEPPPEQGQHGYTSKSKYFKPRYNFSWDWCPRFVSIGVWDSLTLRSGADASVAVKSIRPVLAEDNTTGAMDIVLAFDSLIAPPGSVRKLQAVLTDGGKEVGRATVPAVNGDVAISMEKLAVEPWWPNGEGPQKLYSLELSALDSAGKTTWSRKQNVGFKRVEWRQCEGAPTNAEPWLCVINGRPVFLQGVNWTPVRVAYPDTKDEEYKRLIDIYSDMGCNLLRVWGGGILEKEVFYNLCDAAGVMVWQEFPFSSSGSDNIPPSDDDVIGEMSEVCISYVRKRHMHASLLLWCGGNELHEGRVGMGRPCDYTYKAIARMRDIVREFDPGRRFLATSSSGPEFLGEEKNFGKGLHHDVHGPWTMDHKDIEGWKQFWLKDDALFRSETGEAGATSLDIIKKYSGGLHMMPPEHPYWRHQSGWWGRWNRRADMPKDLSTEEGMDKFIKATQKMQADVLSVSTSTFKARFPRCGGILLWVGHDCVPCPANASVVEFGQRPKPVCEALKKVFRARPEDLKQE